MNIDDDVINLIKSFDFKQPIVFSDGEVPFKIDFMTYVSYVNFEEAWIQKVDTLIDTIPISFINLSHLVISKFNTGKLKDKADIEELQKIQNYRK